MLYLAPLTNCRRWAPRMFTLNPGLGSKDHFHFGVESILALNQDLAEGDNANKVPVQFSARSHSVSLSMTFNPTCFSQPRSINGYQ
jgi:hypothetical protein